jgi:trk system potassium uptake protein TrkH
MVYSIFTIIGILLFIIAKMPVFDSITNTFMLISTGGMAIKNSNMGYYHSNLFNLIGIFIMIIGATSFLPLYRSFKTKGLSILKDIQFRFMMVLIILIFFALYLTIDRLPMDLLFHVISALTTTGASLYSYDIVASWPEFMKVNIILLMLIGGSAGSTGGAIKLIRVATILKAVYINIANIISPEDRVITGKLSGEKLNDSSIKEAGIYVTLYLFLIVLGWLVFSYYNDDALNSLFDIVSAQGNVGISTGIISPLMPYTAKIMTIIHMWAGRLEILPILVLLRSSLEIFKGKFKKPKTY